MTAPGETAEIAFIEARLAEDEAHARKDLWVAERATAQGNWDASYGSGLPYSLLEADGQVIARFTAEGDTPDGDAAHAADAGLAYRMASAARPRAERMLREIAFKRALLDQWRHSPAGSPVLVNAMYQMAAVWSGHPDYLAE